MKLMNIVTMLVYSDDHGGGIVVADVFVVAGPILLLRVIPMVIYIFSAGNGNLLNMSYRVLYYSKWNIWWLRGRQIFTLSLLFYFIY